MYVCYHSTAYHYCTAYYAMPQASNGVCNEGRKNVPNGAGEFQNVTCDLGTDCADCGPWQPSGPVSWWVEGLVVLH